MLNPKQVIFLHFVCLSMYLLYLGRESRQNYLMDLNETWQGLTSHCKLADLNFLSENSVGTVLFQIKSVIPHTDMADIKIK